MSSPSAVSVGAPRPLNSRSQTVYVVDDDASVRRGLDRLLQAANIATVGFGSAQEFLDQCPPDAMGCVLLDLNMPGFTGLELQEALAHINPHLPVIFLTGFGDISSSVRAMKRGAVDFLVKPIDRRLLLAAITSAFGRNAAARSRHVEQQDLQRRFAQLTSREREVVHGVARGQLNKQIAAQLGLVEKTIKVHRARALAKLGIVSVPDLVRLVDHSSATPFVAGSRSTGPD